MHRLDEGLGRGVRFDRVGDVKTSGVTQRVDFELHVVNTTTGELGLHRLGQPGGNSRPLIVNHGNCDTREGIAGSYDGAETGAPVAAFGPDGRAGGHSVEGRQRRAASRRGPRLRPTGEREEGGQRVDFPGH